MLVETTYDLRYNIAALTIAICSDAFMLPEKAFSILEEKDLKIDVADTEDMLALREQGLTYRDIGEIYNSTGSNVYKRLKNYRRKRSEKVV